MSQALLEQSGARPKPEPEYTALHVARAYFGLVTNRCALHDPSTFIVGRFYGGAPDALIDGSNVEISPALTWKRRFGVSAFGSVTYPTPPLTSFAFHNADGSIVLFVDTATGVYIHQ